MSEKKKDDAPDRADAPAPEKAAQTATADPNQPVHDKTIPGGKYLVNGVLVNANGEPINEDGSPVKKG